VKKPGYYSVPHEGTTIRDGKKVTVRRVSFLLPNGKNGVHHCQEPPHKFTEEPDGTLTITASILALGGPQGKDHIWHGYLTKGEWIAC
jgi:hypothetical protein